MIIVTGGAGFIGSAVIWQLNQQGIDNILVVDHLGDSDKWKNLRGLSYLDYLEKDEFRKLVLQDQLPKSIKTIIHLGACSSTTEVDASYLVDNNFNYTKDLILFANSHRIKFIYASSAATYGDGTEGYDDQSQIAKLRPLNIYGYSKQMVDLWAERNGYLNKITGLKFSNVFGPNEYHKGEMRSVPYKAFHQILENGKVHLFESYNPHYADGEQMRDFLYVKDAAKMVLFFIENDNMSGIFNIGSGNARTWNDLSRAIFAALDRKPSIEYIEMPAKLRNRYQYFTELCMEKIRNSGYKQDVLPLEEAISDYVQNYLSNNLYLEN